MLQTVQLCIADAAYAAAVREALSRNCAWHVVTVRQPDFTGPDVIVVDEPGFSQLPSCLPNPERVVLITRKDPQVLANAWEAGLVSLVSQDDPISTVLLAIMAAALRIAKPHETAAAASEISPSLTAVSAPIAPNNRTSGSKRFKTH